MHPPTEKNLKHKTDVLSWEDVRWETCDLNFRAPLEEKLAMAVSRAYSHLLVASAGGTAMAIVIVQIVMPYLVMRSALEALVVAAVIAAVVAGGFYRPLPRSLGKQANARMALLAATAVVFMFVSIRFSQIQKPFAVGLFLLLNVGLPASLFVADQMTAQMIHWMSADPRLDRNTMVTWRNAWSGRFMTEHVDCLRNRGVSPRVIAILKRYWRGHLWVGLALVAAIFVALLPAGLVEIIRLGDAIAAMTTAALAGLAVATHAAMPRAGRLFTQTLGHWFEYHKDTIKPPWVMQSPAGSQLARAFLAYGTAAALSCALALIGLCGGPWDPRTVAELREISAVEVCVVAVAASVLAPAQLLMVCFEVSAPVVSACDQARKEWGDGEA